MRKLFTLLFAVLASVGTLFAWDYERVQIGDMYYNLDATNQTAEVTSQNSDSPFWSTNITTADIPSSVTYNAITYSITSIGQNAFSNCSGLTSITCEATTPPACGEYVFLEVNKTIPLYVPAESVELYKAADVWKEFTNIQGITKTTNAAELWPLIMDNQTYSNLEQYIVSDLRPDEVKNRFEIFPHDDGKGTYTADYTSGLNSCGNNDGYFALSVESFGWAGCGFRMGKQTSISALQSLKEAIVTNPDNYYLHLSIKSTDSYSHCFYIMGNEATKFVLGNKSVYDGPVYSDFERDGKWHEFYIPLAQYASALDTTDFSAGGYAFIAFTEGVSGAKLHLDAVFFCDAEFKDGKFLLPSSGKCGDNLAWKFDQQTGTLTISGSGAMYDFTEDNMPWANHIAAITSIELPDGLTTFGTNAFRNCAGVQAIQIPTSLTASGNDAFYGCTGIKEVHVYNLKGWCNVQFGNAYSNPLFYGQLHMLDETTPTTTLRITADITDLGHAFDNYTFEAIEIEDIASFCTMTSTVRAHKIYLNGKLVEHLVIPEGVTLIRAHAFAEATCLKSVTLPTTMTQIGVNTFGGCSNIEYLTIKAAQPPVIDSTTFDGVNHAIPVNIACSSLDRYISAEHWSKFTNFVVPSYNIVKNDSIYENTAYSWRGREIKTDSCGIFRYADSLRTVDGCDSIIALVLTINPIPAYTVTVTADDEQAGTVAGGGIFKMDSVVTLTATANDGYVFAKWSDGSTDNPYIFTAKEDVELVAYFLKDQAEEAEVTEPQVMPTDSSVVITWPVIEDAVVYTIEIKKDGELICTLLFNEMGQLINIVFAAPARQGENKRMPAATRTANGWQYTISGLDPNTEYTYIVKAQKADETVIYEESIDFVTDNAEAIGNVQRDDVQCTKVLRDGQLYIIRGDKTYTVTGQEVK